MGNKILNQRIRNGLDDGDSARGRERAFGVIRGAMKKMVSQYPELSARLRTIKSTAVGSLDSITEKAVAKLEVNGCRVFRAASHQDAVAYITGIVRQGLIVKSKSNAAKEIDLSSALSDQGSRVIETDLGDRIVQLAGSHASHSLAPAIHMTVEKVAEVFSKDLGQTLPADAEALVKAARVSLRNYLLSADVGLSGANSIAADTGSLIVMENEGNIRAVTSLPRIHIAVAGIEKIVPTLEDALTVVRAASVFGVGQDFGTYASVISGPSKVLDFDGEEFPAGLGPEEVHVVLLEYGRKKAVEEGLEESLYCINCGSCLNFCPIYREIGDRYGDKYLGGRGIITAAVQKGLGAAEESGLSLCLNCQACVEACPSQISTPAMINKLRARKVEQEGLSPLWSSVFKILSREKTLNVATGTGRKIQTFLFAQEENGQRQRLPLGLTYRRLLPQLADQPFRAAWPEVVRAENTAKLFREKGNVRTPRQGKVAFFTGCLINYAQTSVGEAVLAVLTHHGIEVEVPRGQGCCGLPMYLNGDLKQAREAAKANIESFRPESVDAVLVACATCGSFLRENMAGLFADGDPWGQKAAFLAAKTRDISVYLAGTGVELNPEKAWPVPVHSVTYHDACHLGRVQGVRTEPRQLLQAIPGLELREMEDADACCGFGGTCSFKQYEVSERVRSHKLKSIKDTGAEAVAAPCPGCITHINDGIFQEGLAQKVYHPVELLALAYGWKGRN